MSKIVTPLSDEMYRWPLSARADTTPFSAIVVSNRTPG